MNTNCFCINNSVLITGISVDGNESFLKLVFVHALYLLFTLFVWFNVSGMRDAPDLYLSVRI